MGGLTQSASVALAKREDKRVSFSVLSSAPWGAEMTLTSATEWHSWQATQVLQCPSPSTACEVAASTEVCGNSKALALVCPGQFSPALAVWLAINCTLATCSTCVDIDTAIRSPAQLRKGSRAIMRMTKNRRMTIGTVYSS